jgi:hypothetical protein
MAETGQVESLVDISSIKARNQERVTLCIYCGSDHNFDAAELNDVDCQPQQALHSSKGHPDATMVVYFRSLNTGAVVSPNTALNRSVL